METLKPVNSHKETNQLFTEIDPSDYSLEALHKKIDKQAELVNATAKDLHRIKQFFLWSLIATVVTFVVPLLAAIVLIPIFMGNYLGGLENIL